MGVRAVFFAFVGTNCAARTETVPSVAPFAGQFGVDEQVTEIPHQIGHLECMRLHRQADVLLIAGSSDLAYLPSKIYTYCLSGRPMLSLAAQGSVFERLVEELGCSAFVRFSVAGGNTALADAFDRMVAGTFEKEVILKTTLNRAPAHFADALTMTQCHLFDTACLD